MKREEDWHIRAEYHKRQAEMHKNSYKLLLKRCFQDPSLRGKADAEWAEYKRHKDRADYCFNKSIVKDVNK